MGKSKKAGDLELGSKPMPGIDHLASEAAAWFLLMEKGKKISWDSCSQDVLMKVAFTDFSSKSSCPQGALSPFETPAASAVASPLSIYERYLDPDYKHRTSYQTSHGPFRITDENMRRCIEAWVKDLSKVAMRTSRMVLSVLDNRSLQNEPVICERTTIINKGT